MFISRQSLCAFAATALVPSLALAADLPTHKAAPVEYVRVCDAYGAGFFYIPGTDTCLKVGGMVLAQAGILPSSQLYSMAYGLGSPVVSFAGAGFPGLAGSLPSASNYRSVFARETFGYTAVGRVELDARTQSSFGTVRTFIRLQSNYGAGASYSTGSLASGLGLNAFSVTAGPTVSREIAYLDKAFIQFAGITAGRVQSFFDFYADAINYSGLKGPNATAFALAYTWTFAGGLSGTIAIEDAASHRGPIASVINVANVAGISPAAALAGGSVTGLIGAARMPNIIANIRWDQPWGSVQLSGALNQIRANLFPAAAATAGTGGAPAAYAESVAATSSLGFAINAGVQFNLPMLGEGDKLWIQGTYAHGAIGYVQGSNMLFLSGVNSTAAYGIGGGRSNNAVGWTGVADVDCVFTYLGTCDKSNAFVVLAALKHYWSPTVSSGLFGSYFQSTYSNAAQFPVNPFVGAAHGAGSLFAVGMNNFKDVRVGTNLVWTPIKNFDIGAEIVYARYMSQRPFGLAPDVVLQSFGLPKFSGVTNQYLGAIRMLRAF